MNSIDLPAQSDGPQVDTALEVESREVIRTEVRRTLLHTPGTVSEQVHQLLDQLLIDEALNVTQGSQVKPAKLIGISRTRLRNRLQPLDLHRE